MRAARRVAPRCRTRPALLALVIASDTKGNRHLGQIRSICVVDIAAKRDRREGTAKVPCDTAVAALARGVGAVDDCEAVDRKEKGRLIGRQSVDVSDGPEGSKHGRRVVAGSVTEVCLGDRNRIGSIVHGESCRAFNLKLQCCKVVGDQFAVQGKPPQRVLLPRISATRKLRSSSYAIRAPKFVSMASQVETSGGSSQETSPATPRLGQSGRAEVGSEDRRFNNRKQRARSCSRTPASGSWTETKAGSQGGRSRSRAAGKNRFASMRICFEHWRSATPGVRARFCDAMCWGPGGQFTE